MVEKVLAEIDDADFKNIAINVAHYHHEKWDGSGYPEHLKGNEIPLEARIMALADVFDALVSKRCYKEAKSFDEAFEIIKNDLGHHFDPEIGKIFIQCRPQLIAYYSSSVNEL
jgi:HD-GYP domain-containing protein (c-di-GMP phosphodiesterase class II)